MRLRVSMRWWLALAFAAVAALTAVVVAEVFTQRAETSFRSRAGEAQQARPSAPPRSSVLRSFAATLPPPAEQATIRRVALFVFDPHRRLLSAPQSRGSLASKVPSLGPALDRALAGGRYVRAFDHGQRIVVGLPLNGGRAGGLVVVASRPGCPPSSESFTARRSFPRH